MFRTVPAAAPEPAENVDSSSPLNGDLIPLSHLGLELGAPVEGWPVFLGVRGIRFVSGRDWS
jgi:hypothetical protein